MLIMICWYLNPIFTNYSLLVLHSFTLQYSLVLTRSCYSGFQLLVFTSTLGVHVLRFRMLFTSFHLLSVLRIYSSLIVLWEYFLKPGKHFVETSLCDK